VVFVCGGIGITLMMATLRPALNLRCGNGAQVIDPIGK
jgi:hypothetical protein